MPSPARSTHRRARLGLVALVVVALGLGLGSETGRAAAASSSLAAKKPKPKPKLHRWSSARWPQRVRARAGKATARRAKQTATRAARTRSGSSSSVTSLSRFGLAAGGNMHNLGEAELARELDDYKALASGWIRLDINWSLIQREGPSNYDWASFDRVVAAARARGLSVLATILYTPEWARPGTPDSTYAPFDLEAYANFCREAVKHYSPLGVQHWEIWNEPNIGFWKPEPDPTRYAAMLKLAYPAIKQADAQAFVISAGLSPYGGHGQVGPGLMNPLTFLERMYAAGARGSFDALGWHPYEFAGFGFHPMSAWSQLAETTPSVRSIMEANGDREKQVWGTEYGAPTGGSGAVSEVAQAAMVTGAYARWKAWSWAGPLFWFSFRNAGTSESDREHNFGLVRSDFSPKPSFAAYREAAQAG